MLIVRILEEAAEEAAEAAAWYESERPGLGTEFSDAMTSLHVIPAKAGIQDSCHCY